MFARLLPLLLLFSVGLNVVPTAALAHGSVSPDDDLCIIRIGYFRAHFKIYLPRRRQHQEYCEDIPATGEAIFVMEYEHAGLGDIPIDFRVIRNVTGKGNFTILEDIENIPDLDSVTLFHHQAAIQPDVFTFMHQFTEQGKFVGIVTVEQPDTGETYTAVFPFTVGFTGVGIWPWFVVAAVFLQLNYLWMTGWFSKRRQRSLDVASHA